MKSDPPSHCGDPLSFAMKWFTSSSSAASALDEPRLLKMEKLETSSVVAAAVANASHRAGSDSDNDDDEEEDGDYGPTSLAPSFTRPFDLGAEATSGSRSLDFCDVSTLESRARRGIRGKRNVGGGRSDRGKKSRRERAKRRTERDSLKSCFVIYHQSQAMSMPCRCRSSVTVTAVGLLSALLFGSAFATFIHSDMLFSTNSAVVFSPSLSLPVVVGPFHSSMTAGSNRAR